MAWARRLLRFELALAVIASLAIPAFAGAAPVPAPPRTARAAMWSALNGDVLTDLRAGRPLVTVVMVPLCSNRQIRCGGQGAGDPASLDKNLYWGRGFGVRRYFAETAHAWKLVARSRPGPIVLEQLVYARDFPAENFGLGQGLVRHLVVLRAVHGDAIGAAVDEFYDLATHGGDVHFDVDGVPRAARVHVAGYAGHNVLMDGHRLKSVEARSSASPLPSFVIACRSAPYFSTALEASGSTPLVMTRDLVAPEGYVIEALLNALGQNRTPREIRAGVVNAYARWQKLSDRVAGTIFDSGS